MMNNICNKKYWYIKINQATKEMPEVHIIRILIWVIMLTSIPLTLHAQEDLEKEVYVVKPYEPKISDAYKINTLPKTTDTIKATPSFRYSIIPKPIKSDFKVRPIKPAKMVGVSLSQLYKTYLKLGMGNHFMPHAELYMNNLRSKEWSYGAFINYTNTSGKVKLDNGDKTDAGYADTHIGTYGKKIYRNVNLEGKAGFKSNKILYYGYRPDIIIDPKPDKKDIRQVYNTFYAKSSLYSTSHDENGINYMVNLEYNHFRNTSDQYENNLLVSSTLNHMISEWSGNLFTTINYLESSDNINSLSHLNISAFPTIEKKTDEWQVTLGVKSFFHQYDNEWKSYFYPVGILEFDVVERILTPFIGVSGDFVMNTYQSMVEKNKFLNPGVISFPTRNKFKAFAGFKGNISSKLSYNIKGSANTLKDMYLFVNDSNALYQNQFTIVRDNIDLTSVFCELTYAYSEKLNIEIKGNYNDYLTEKESKAWHLPEWELTGTAYYNLRDKILINSTIYWMDKRYAKPYHPNEEVIELKPFADLNLGLEYRYSRTLSIFLDFYNITSSNYEQWNQYPVYKFNILAGFTYAL